MALQSHAFLFSLVGSGEYMIVCPQSPVLTAALSGGFQKATSKIITVNEFHIRKYQLCSKREHKSSSDDGHNQDNTDHMSHETVEDLLSHLRVNAIADYYNIQNLAQLANSQIRVILEKGQMLIDPDVCSIIASAAATCVEELSELQAFQEVELKHNLSMEILRAYDEARMKTSFIEQIDKYMDLLKQTYGCCHCAKGFGCYFEKKCLEGHSSLCPTLQTMSLSAHISFVRRSANIEELHSKDS
ncbi:uncharacterized protein BKA55DRAFT_595139 [Fusarium redolens]|uniref:Uncharacterized protein n=1 Tax=Fusarium redolens TaxID=48865 RepID=A0A9P9GY41_FUSRE|nr:uncharacterized protein BKA55DRAFT_595139 [Fusarium redolens]KAH7247525.1 hypothetical protein BKA55DRAFT_595139 [Fusarium redolens]